MEGPQSCDTFVVLPDKTKGNVVIFGKNSDRPKDEVQEVVYVPAADHADGTKVQCTFIEIAQVAHTHATMLSKPSWMWGAEMGSNSKGVCVGNEAVWTNAMDGESEKVERLLGMDLVRLSLERSSSAAEAVDVITSLLETHGQGGLCSDTETGLVYHNSFLVADHSEAWVVETADKLWVAQKISEGYRNISNCLTIGTDFCKSSKDIQEVAKEKGYWDGTGDFNFAKALGSGSSDCDRQQWGEKLLKDLTKEGSFGLRDMISILRHESSGISRAEDHAHPTTASLVSIICSPDSSCGPSSHWFTGTPNPLRSVFKPFVFTPNPKSSPFIKSPELEDDPAKSTPRFSRPVDRSHVLYRRQQAASKAGGEDIVTTLRSIEEQCIEETLAHLKTLTPDTIAEVGDLFKDCVDSELKFYK